MKNKKKNRVLLLIGIFVIILIILAIILNKQTKKDNTVSNNTENIENTETSDLEDLKDMNEKQRIKTYFSKYINYIENGDIQSAYNILYGEFKNTYFKTQEDYEKYVKEKYPDIIAVNYKDVQKEGVYVILTVEIQDLINESSFEQKFIIREYDYNDFVLSFQAE